MVQINADANYGFFCILVVIIGNWLLLKCGYNCKIYILSLHYCGYNTREVITKERFAMARVRYFDFTGGGIRMSQIILELFENAHQ